LAQERDSLSVINDQTGAPTGAELIADVTAHIIRTALGKPEVAGVYHLVAGGETTWFGFAKLVLETASLAGKVLKVQPDDVQAIPTSAYPTPAKRPHNSRLSTEKLQTTFNLTLPSWQSGVVRMLNEYLA
jgi:dTDP-4-dehydrorhamnose reductase